MDFIGLSFVREKSDIEQLRKLLARKKSKAQIVAKIEDQLAVRSIDKMIESADVIMVARGDLGIECPMEDLPIIQRRIVKNCLRLGKPVIVATQLLESMITNPLPRGRDHRRGKCSFRTGRRSDVERRNDDRPLPG